MTRRPFEDPAKISANITTSAAMEALNELRRLTHENDQLRTEAADLRARVETLERELAEAQSFIRLMS